MDDISWVDLSDEPSPEDSLSDSDADDVDEKDEDEPEFTVRLGGSGGVDIRGGEGAWDDVILGGGGG